MSVDFGLYLLRPVTVAGEEQHLGKLSTVIVFSLTMNLEKSGSRFSSDRYSTESEKKWLPYNF